MSSTKPIRRAASNNTGGRAYGRPTFPGTIAVHIDFGRTADDYARYRVGFPESFFDRLDQLEIGGPNQRILDLATGTGTIARGLARRGASVIALDRSDALVAEARRLNQQTGVVVEYLLACAEASGLPDAAFDVVTAGQSWHWFDRPPVAREVRRLLVPAERLVIAHFDWLPLKGSLADSVEQLILRHNPEWKGAGGQGMYPWWWSDVRQAGFSNIESFTHDEDAVYSRAARLGRVRASAGVGAALSLEAVERFEADHVALLDARFPDDSLRVPHRVFGLTCTSP